MFSGHPHINRTYTRQGFTSEGRLLQQLVIETKLKNPQSGDHSDKGEWTKLYDYAAALAANSFIEFQSIELRGKGESS